MLIFQLKTKNRLKLVYKTGQIASWYISILAVGAMSQDYFDYLLITPIQYAATLTFLRLDGSNCLLRIKENKGVRETENFYSQVISLLLRVYFLISSYRHSCKEADFDSGITNNGFFNAIEQQNQCSESGFFADFDKMCVAYDGLGDASSFGEKVTSQ